MTGRRLCNSFVQAVVAHARDDEGVRLDDGVVGVSCRTRE
jgi:hypothetical protein